MEQRLARELPGPLYEHSLRVATTARHLAEQNQVDPEQAYLAGLLHDWAKPLPGPELLALARQYSLPVSEVEARVPTLLHGPVAAALLPTAWGVADPAVLEAIRLHTTGAPGMSKLAQVVWLADYIEPGRSFPGLEAVRAATDLRAALRLALDQTIRYLLDRGWLVDPLTVQTRNWLLEE